MSSSNNTNNVRSYNQSCSKWSGFNIAAVVISFILCWPIGLFIMFWIISGRNVKDIPQTIRNQWSNLTGNWQNGNRFYAGDQHDNVVFNEYQQTQHDRIHEIKEEIRAQSRRFKEFRDNMKRRKDQDEFNNFMADKPASSDI